MLATEHRIAVPLSSMSPSLINAVVAIEDRKFFDHEGFDPARIFGSALAVMRAGKAVQGGSTITQQLARQSLGREKTLRRKLKELLFAIELERTFTKHEILELYLNKVYFGDGLYGAEAASRGYFGKAASELTAAEAALLAGLLQAPSALAPTVSIEKGPDPPRHRPALHARNRCDLAGPATKRPIGNRSRCATACGFASGTGCTSRRKCDGNSSSCSEASGSLKGACACTRRSISRCNARQRKP